MSETPDSQVQTIENQADAAMSLLDQGRHYGAIVFMLYALTLAVLAVARAITRLTGKV